MTILYHFYFFFFRWADQQKSENSEGLVTEFNHPFFQADGMFLGEFTCKCFKIVYNISLKCFYNVKLFF